MKIYSDQAIALRAVLYCLGAALPELLTAFDGHTAVNWPFTLTKIALAVVIALRAYVDKSSGQTESDLIAMAPSVAPAVASVAGNAAQGAVQKAVAGASVKIGNQVENAVNSILGGDHDAPENDESNEEIVAPSQ